MLEAEQTRIRCEMQRKQKEILEVDEGFSKVRLYWYVISDGSVHYAFNEKEGVLLACITEDGHTLYDCTYEVARRRVEVPVNKKTHRIGGK